MLNDREAVEIFHLHFLRGFGQRVDKALFALKDGCNLRFYFRSIRYSEDMDLDIHTLAVGTLSSHVNRLLDGPLLRQALASQRLEVARVAKPKQTPTTQRWKVTLRHLDTGREIPTKIEFSRRPAEGERGVDPVDAHLIQRYRLMPVLAPHYRVGTAFAQKVAALARREQVQSRDVFDLKLLLDAGGAAQASSEQVRPWLETALANAQAVDYEQFAGQVVPYLDAEYQDYYAHPTVWNELRGSVVDALKSLQP